MIMSMLRFLKHLILIVVINMVVLYLCDHYHFWFRIDSSQYQPLVTFAFLGIVFWFFNSIIKKLLKLLAFPLKFFTLGLSSFVINVFVLYLFEYIINANNLGVVVHLWTLLHVVVLSCSITFIYFLVKYIK